MPARTPTWWRFADSAMESWRRLQDRPNPSVDLHRLHPAWQSARTAGSFAVTEGGNNLIDTFAINSDGTLGSIVTSASSGPGPFSIEFAPSGALLVTEAPNSSL